jgi:hypothetical protein
MRFQLTAGEVVSVAILAGLAFRLRFDRAFATGTWASDTCVIGHEAYFLKTIPNWLPGHFAVKRRISLVCRFVSDCADQVLPELVAKLGTRRLPFR